jgi:uncharacterized metal-binding protein YceD (DUF177 family)
VVVPLDSIPARGLTVQLGPWAQAACERGLGVGGLGVAATCAGALSLSRHGPHIRVRGTLSGAATLPCDRCGEAVSLRIEGQTDCLYSPVSTLPARGGDDADSPPLPPGAPTGVEDVGEYDGVALDLAAVVCEFFVLERPAVLRCGDIDAAAGPGCDERLRSFADRLVQPAESNPTSPPFATRG